MFVIVKKKRQHKAASPNEDEIIFFNLSELNFMALGKRLGLRFSHP